MRCLVMLAMALGMNVLATAQGSRLIAVDVETGFNVRSSDRNSLTRLRGYNPTDKEWGDGRRRRDAYMSCWYVGAKPEIKINEKLSFDAGLRLTVVASSLRRKNNRSMNWKYAEHGTNTLYISVDRFEQTSLYVGVPVDIRFVPADLDATSVYLKAGCAFNVRALTRNRVETCYDSMQDRYADRIASQINNPKSLAIPIWMGVGIQFGYMKGACIEMTFPYIMNLAQMSSLCKTRGTGFGLQFTYRIPTIKND